MKIDASQILTQGGVKIKSGTSSVTDSLKEGDVIRATVVSNDKNGVLNIKLDNGQMLAAKLDTDMMLSQGEILLLEVSDKDKNQISLSFSGVETAEDDVSVEQPGLVREFSDKSLAPYAAKLAELNIPVTESSAHAMRELMAQHPNLTMDEAAFLASNKITSDESLMKAALDVLSGGDKTDAMIAKLLSSLGDKSFIENLDLGTLKPEYSISGLKLGDEIPDSPKDIVADLKGVVADPKNGAIARPLTELVAVLVKNAPNLYATANQTDPIPTQESKPIIPQTDNNMQLNMRNGEEILQQPFEDALEQGVKQQVQTQGEGITNVQTTVSSDENIPLTSGAAQSSEIPLQGETQRTLGVESSQSQAASEAEMPQSQTAHGIANPESIAKTVDTRQSETVGNTLARLLSEISEFKGTPPAALERFSDMLLRVARDAVPAHENSGNVLAKDTDLLTAQLEKMFTKIGVHDANAGMRLREAREELFARIALAEEEMSRASGTMRTVMHSQAQKLMDHVRLLNSINQFAYMQLPVVLGEERKTAELYVFKRKGGRKADPDNVNILLAIDLEFMGHWEALVNIKGKDVYVNMEVAGEAERRHFSENTVLLHKMLDEEGFKLVNTSIKISEEETTPLTALSAFDRYTGRRQGRIDFKI